MRRLATIGVYGFSVDAFVTALLEAGVTMLLDVRQRRGVRGTEYAWANAQRLQSAMAEVGIAYRHLSELAPTTELRQLQYTADDRAGASKRTREVLSPEYARRYTGEILDRADLDAIAEELPARGTAALFCVERDPEACHRLLVAERLAARTGLELVHLRPASAT